MARRCLWRRLLSRKGESEDLPLWLDLDALQSLRHKIVKDDFVKRPVTGVRRLEGGCDDEDGGYSSSLSGR